MNNNTIEQYINTIQCCDCLEGMRRLPDKCIDLVVTSPPYNLKNSTGNGMKDGRGGKWSNAALINGYATSASPRWLNVFSPSPRHHIPFHSSN